MPELPQTFEPDYSLLTADETLDRLIELKSVTDRAETDRAALLDRLDVLADAGEVDRGGFSHNDWSIGWSAGKKMYAYPAAVTELEKQLKEAQAQAKANGTATETRGKAYWTIAKPK